MATIKAIEASSVHQIQSGQVIVDLCSVAKELVENGLDAGATSIEVRFKNQGLDSIEVQDNGSGISPENHETLALKHYTSKLSTYSDLSTLETFGFRGEALSSLCALSRFTVVTCLQSDAPKGTKLEFETSGKVKSRSVVASQKGTTVTVENLFQNLPVRRRELERNIKREWGKVIGLLNQYACVQTGVKFTVSQLPNKGKRIVLFSTKGNKTTRENIINVFGAKTMSALVALDLRFELESTSGPSQRWSAQGDDNTKEILIRGYVSRPVHGEGRQTPDRQMFYVNSRPCGLPQFAKVFNEVYRSYNSSQSPFIFADIQLDTHLYDVNVSPDKRTILLHDQGRMLDNLRDSLTELFEKQEYTVPMSQIATFKQPSFKRSTLSRQETNGSEGGTSGKSPDQDTTPACREKASSEVSEGEEDPGLSRMKKLAAAKALSRDAPVSDPMTRWSERKLASQEEANSKPKEVVLVNADERCSEMPNDTAPEDDAMEVTDTTGTPSRNDPEQNIQSADSLPLLTDTEEGNDDILGRIARLRRSYLPESLRDDISDSASLDEPPIPAISKPVKPTDPAPLSVSAPRASKRPTQEVATITIGDHTVTSIIGTSSKRQKRDDTPVGQPGPAQSSKAPKVAAALPSFGGRLTQMFAAASAKRDLSDEEGPLHSDDIDIAEEAEPSEEDDESEGSPISGPEAGADSDCESSKFSELFVDQDEDEPSSPPAVETDEDVEVLEESDKEYVDEEEAKAQEETEAQQAVEGTEETGQGPSEDNQKRTQAFLKGGGKGKNSTQALLQRLKVDEESLQRRLRSWDSQLRDYASARRTSEVDDVDGGLEAEAENAEQKLALSIDKGDFGKMKIVGQFNLGFILAVRPSTTKSDTTTTSNTQADNSRADDDELFIIDQHASDEKSNFERLQSTTIVQSQRLVRPKQLELTAVEEEIVIENRDALEANGFLVEVDESGDEPVGSRCQLLSLPLSRETTFSLADLEELISLLGDNPTTSSPSCGADGGGGATTARKNMPRPSKVRKMFAMRACRSSIMIGKALSHRQMEKVVRHMGDMEKPWNCPHGRPTMRHLCGLGGAWDEKGWTEGDRGDDYVDARTTDWAGYVKRTREG
ncbi:Mismatch repair endonuclease PMS2 [Cytospora mali]|uniref:DNA mismatch repair protein PMS1 n=1 Tax=Cytospora mali TaxID=578113 RepID=A0A194VXT8_CYTMA|nr:Mismatch repair endonuclease PMS2 [Valsa mali]